MDKMHEVKDISFTGDQLFITIDGKSHRFKLVEISSRLQKATPNERANFEISPSGYGIHWPLIDEDISIDGLLGIKHSPATVRSSVQSVVRDFEKPQWL